MKAKYIIPVLIIAVITLFSVRSIKNKREEKKERQELVRIEQEEKEAIWEGLKEKYNIKSDWHEKLQGDASFRLSDVKTIELEKYWIDEGPIMFKGFLSDISTYDSDHYLCEFGENGLILGFLNDEFILSLTAPKAVIDNINNAHPGLTKSIFPEIFQEIYIVATINSISKDYTVDEEGERITLWLGQGNLEDIVYYD